MSQIINQLKATAQGEAYHGKALRAAKEHFQLSKNELKIIEAWETGAYASDLFEYRMRLQDIAIRLDLELKNNASATLETRDAEQEEESAGPGM